MADLIETRRVRRLIEEIQRDADRRRADAVNVPALGAIYTAMAFAHDDIIARLEGLLTSHTLRAPDGGTSRGDTA